MSGASGADLAASRLASAVVLSLAFALIGVAACTGQPSPRGDETTPAPTSPTTSVRAVSTTTTSATPMSAPVTPAAGPVEVSLRLHPHEELATRRGVSIEVAVEGEVLAHLDDTAPAAVVAIVSPAEVELRYVAPDGSPTEVSWRQQVTDDQTAVVVAQPWRDPPATSAPGMVVAWQTDGDAAEYLEQLAAAAPVTVSSPLTWFVTAEGELTGAVDVAFVAQAHERGVSVWPALHGLDADALHLLLREPDRRSAAASAISTEAEQAGVDGVNIDLEGFRNADAADLSAFVEELARRVHEWGGVVSYDLVPRSDSWDVAPADVAHWSTAPQRRRLAAAVDFTVLMAYDQHNRFRPAGPVAAPVWVEEVLIYMLRYADPGSVILGVPAYGRLWNPDALEKPRAVSLAALDRLDGERSFDDAFGLDRIDLDDGRFFWVDNEATAQRVDLAAEYGLAGWAVWRLGLDHSGLWEAFPGPS